MLKKIIQYISYDIWFKKEYEYRSTKVRWFVRQLKVLLFTAAFSHMDLTVTLSKSSLSRSSISASFRYVFVRLTLGLDVINEIVLKVIGSSQ